MTAALILAILFQVTPLPSPTAPPPPPTPAPSPSATGQPSPSAQPSPNASSTPAAQLASQPAAVALHPGQSGVVQLTGGNGTLTATLDQPLASAAVDQTARTITVTASQQTGQAMLTVTDSTGASLQIPVRVAYDAGVVPAQLSVQITGDQIDPQWLQSQIQKAIAKAVQTQPGAAAQIGPVTLPTLLSPGASAEIPVQVQIPGGAQYFDVNAQTSVALQNVDAGPFSSQLLFYDDDPEKVVADGTLYRNQIAPNAPARLYYYHQNANDPRRIIVALTSAAPNDPSTVQLIDASAGPNIDVMSVGHAVSRDFLTSKSHNQGIVVQVAPAAPYIADEFTMQPQDGAAGSIGVRVLSGGPVEITVLAVPPTVTDAAIAQYLNQPQLPGDGHHRTGAFSLNGYGAQTLPYTVGGDDAMTQYGATTPPPVDGAGHDYGDYGVVRTMTFAVQNPGTQPATVYLFEEPMGGVVRSSFLVDGTLDQVGCARVSQRYQIGQPITVNPGNSNVVVETMTDGGSNYPLAVGMTATPPLPTTPPISAPDGCFPKPQPSPAATPVPSPSPSGTPAATPVPSPSPTGAGA